MGLDRGKHLEIFHGTAPNLKDLGFPKGRVHEGEIGPGISNMKECTISMAHGCLYATRSFRSSFFPKVTYVGEISSGRKEETH